MHGPGYYVFRWQPRTPGSGVSSFFMADSPYRAICLRPPRPGGNVSRLCASRRVSLSASLQLENSPCEPARHPHSHPSPRTALSGRLKQRCSERSSSTRATSLPHTSDFFIILVASTSEVPNSFHQKTVSAIQVTDLELKNWVLTFLDH